MVRDKELLAALRSQLEKTRGEHDLDEDEVILAGFQSELGKIRGGQGREAFLKELTIVRGNWKEWKDTKNFQEIRAALHRIAEDGGKLRDQIGSMSPQETTREHMSAYSIVPVNAAIPENVAPLGRTLFTDFLLPVELGGTLLLVATIGAIAISGRRVVPPHPNPLPRRGEGKPLEPEGRP